MPVQAQVCYQRFSFAFSRRATGAARATRSVPTPRTSSPADSMLTVYLHHRLPRICLPQHPQNLFLAATLLTHRWFSPRPSENHTPRADPQPRNGSVFGFWGHATSGLTSALVRLDPSFRSPSSRLAVLAVYLCARPHPSSLCSHLVKKQMPPVQDR